MGGETDLHKQLCKHLYRFGFRFFANRRLGETTSRLTNDVASIRTALTDTVPNSIPTTFSADGKVQGGQRQR